MGGDPEGPGGVHEGQIIAGKYRVDRVMGVGGMGVVVEAHHLQLDTKVAIKFLRSELLADDAAVLRFAREARAAVRITSEHVARVLDVGTLETGAPFMVMEFLAGSDLHDVLENEGPLEMGQAVDFVLQACEAIAEAHALGIVHRDVKPSNLFRIRRADGKLAIKVLDFGISKVTGGMGASALSVTSTLMGSPFYMSPEQMGATLIVDGRADIWALGVTLFELLTGTVPFAGNTLPELSFNVIVHPPRPLRDFRPDIAGRLEPIIGRCLEKDRENRYSDVGALAVALGELDPHRTHAIVERILGISRHSTSPEETLSERSPRPSARPPAASETLMPLGATPGKPTVRPASRTKMVLSVAILSLAAVAAAVHFAGHPDVGESDRRATSVATPFDARPQATASLPPAVSPVVVREVLPSPSFIELAASSTPAGSAALAAHPPGKVTPRAKSSTSAGPAHKSPSASPAEPKVDCDPNFYLDGQGDKHFKPECFLRHD